MSGERINSIGAAALIDSLNPVRLSSLLLVLCVNEMKIFTLAVLHDGLQFI
jgi:hypothetical protein